MAEFASDTFTGTEGDLLDAYSANWTKHTAGSATTAEIASGRVRGTASGGAMYYHSGSPANADYSVLADVYEASDPTAYAVGVVGRVDTTAVTGYTARHGRTTALTTDAWQLYKFVAGTFTQLGSNSTDAITTGTSAQVELRMSGTTIALYKRGETTPVISVTDSAITAAGKAGIRLGYGGSNTPSDTTLYHLDNFSAVDAGSSVAISGNAATGSVGSLGRAVSKAVTGSAGTGAAGTLSVSVSKAISGNAATGATGTLGKEVAKAVSGNAGTGSVGTLGRAIAKALSGNAGAGAAGSLGVTGATSVAIAGNAATGSIGGLAKAVSLALPGNAAAGNIGIFRAAVSKSLSGNGGGGTVGVFGLAIRKAIAGNSSTGAAGALGVAGEVVLSVPGSADLMCSSASASLTTQKASATW